MRLSVSYSVSQNIPQTPDAERYKTNFIADRFAYELSKMIGENKDCVISERIDDAVITTRYEVHVFSPEQLQQLFHHIESKIRCGLPVII